MASVNGRDIWGEGWRPDEEGEARSRLIEPVFSNDSLADGGRCARPVGERTLDRIVDRVAPSRVSVLITGETGVGKDVLAHRIHDLSPRASKPFIAVNCAAFTETLIESELFGHERGAFTGADKMRVGLFEAASGGTLFLDEVGELSPQAQAKLLRVLDTKRLTRLGSSAERAVDVRLVAATNRDLAEEVAHNRFRSDLLFRLDGVRLSLSPLRDRPWEILPAAREFLAEHARREGVSAPTLTEAAANALCEHTWSGNFRELRNVIERAAILCDDGRISPEDLGLAPTAPGRSGSGRGASREDIVEALSRCAGNQSRAAELLGISRRTLITRLDAYGIKRPRPGRAGGGGVRGAAGAEIELAVQKFSVKSRDSLVLTGRA
jgi:DNA-binding NtrC family response regulator